MERYLSRTQISARFRGALDLANDVTCFQAFIHDGFIETATKSFEQKQARLASEAFPDNPHAKRVDLSLELLIDLGSQSAGWGLMHGLMISIEHVLSYCEEALGLVAKYQTPRFKKSGELGPEEYLQSVIEQHNLGINAGDTFKTATYFRHVRNHIAHARANPISSMTNFNRQNAHDLNKFWAGKPARLSSFDFGTFDASRASFQELLAAISIMRITLSDLDELVAQCLPVSKVVIEVRDLLLESSPGLKSSNERMLRKIQKTIEMDYGLKLLSTEISEHLIGS